MLRPIDRAAGWRFAMLLACIAAFAANRDSLAQAYPSKPLKLIVPLGVGAPPDVSGRLLAQRMAESMGQAVVVENRGGAGGTVGGGTVAKSAPDGYTLLMGSSSSLVIGPTLFPASGYDSTKVFAPISLVANQPFIFAVPAALRVDNLRDFIALVKANPGTFNYGSPQTGSPPNMSGELFMRITGTRMVHVAFGSIPNVVLAMVRGDAQFNIEVAPVFMSQIRAGTIKALATAGARRSPFLPEVPTTAEAGLADFEIGSWSGMVAPAGTPATIVKRLNAEIHKAVASKEVQDGFLKQMAEVQLSTPEEMAQHIAGESAKWTRVIIDAGIRAN